jgi:hypothetical protein
MHLHLLKLILLSCSFSILIGCNKSPIEEINPANDPSTQLNDSVELIIGIVKDHETNLPIENATVTLVRLAGMEKNQAYGETLAIANTDSSGEFGIPKYIGSGFYAKYDNIRICAPEYESLLYQGSKAQKKKLPIFLKKGKSIKGKVLDTNGSPIPNALVGNLYVDDRNNTEAKKTDFQFFPSFWNFTDEDGNFQLEGIREGFQPYIRVVADGYLLNTTDRIDPEKTTEITINLEKGAATLRGTVLEENGVPSPFKTVSITSNFCAEKIKYNKHHLNIEMIVQTDENGQFTIHNLPPIKHRVIIQRRNKNVAHPGTKVVPPSGLHSRTENRLAFLTLFRFQHHSKAEI